MHAQAAIVAGATFEGRYEILAEIGSGGFGTVYQAKQHATGQLVAIKVLRWQERHGPSWDRKLARFLREMHLCAQLHHPNVVRLIDAGRSDEGPVYTVFEFVPGRNLADVLAHEGALDPVEARHLMVQVLDGLASAHAKEIVHRDLKPKNIMVTTGARRNALILDFGIGAITGADDESEDLTLTGEMVGSPGYAAPEQFLRARPTTRSDLFSWALVFLECLTGVASEPIHRRVLQRLDAQPVPLPSPLSDHPLGDILRRALVKDVSARDASAEDLLRQLETCDVRDLPLADVAQDGVESSHPPSRRVSRVVPRTPDTGDRTSASARVVPRRERRQVTALCCRMETRPRGTLPEDIEDADEQLDAAQRLIAETARRFSGWTVAAAPDALVVCFGYPMARGDDATRAALAALAIDAAVRQSAPNHGGGSHQAEVAFGLHTGLVMARETSESYSALGPVIGTTLRVAMDMARRAKPGSILVSGETRRVTEALFDYRNEGEVDSCSVKFETFTLLATRGIDVPVPASVRQTPMVGRERDLAAILELSEMARRGVGQSVLVHGEAGIGKSRIVREIVRSLQRSGVTVLEGRCGPDTVHRTLHPFIDFLERTLELGSDGGQPVATPAEKTRKVETLVKSYGFDPQEAVPLFLTLLGVHVEAPYRPLEVSSAKQREMTGEVLLSLLLEMADAHPVVLLLEDLHWADPSTRELLAKITAAASASPLLVLMTARPEFVPSWSPSSVVSVTLPRLERLETEQLVSKVTLGTSLPKSVLDRVVERTDGVPLFIEELVSALLDSGELVLRDGRYELTRPLADVSVPTTLRASLTARLDKLGRAKHTAQLASIIGREFPLDVLTALASAPEAEVRADLEVLVGFDLVHRRRRRRESIYSFKHALVRDAAYELLPKSERQQAHARLASVLEGQFAGVVESRPDVLARHHAAAHQMEQALTYAKRAIGGALQRSANAEVIASVREALTWVPELAGETERATAELELNGLLTMALIPTYGCTSAVSEVLVRSQALLPLVGEGPLAMGTRWATLMYHHHRAERKEARALAEALVAAAEARDDRDQLVAALPTLGQCAFLEGNLTESRKHLERALALYDPERHRHHALVYLVDPKAFAQSTLSLVLWLLGDRDDAWAHGNAAVAWARELRHAPSEAVALLYLVGLPHYEQDHAKAIEVIATLNGVVERYGLLLYQAFCGVLGGWADRNAEPALQCVAMFRMAGQEIGLSYYLSLVAECDAASGAHASALARIDEAIEHAEKTGEMYYAPDLYRLKGTWLGQVDPNGREAEVSLRRAIELARDRSQRPAELRASLALGRMMRGSGRDREARDLVKVACDRYEDRIDWGDLQAARAFVSQTTG